MTDLTTRAAALLAAAEKMTPGEWKAYASVVQMARAGGFDMRRCPEPKENATGIVALHNDAPALIRELLAENERLRKPIGIDDSLPWEQTLMALVDQWKGEAESLRAENERLEAVRDATTRMCLGEQDENERLRARIAEMDAERKFADAQRAQLFSVGKELSDEITKLSARVAELESVLDQTVGVPIGPTKGAGGEA